MYNRVNLAIFCYYTWRDVSAMSTNERHRLKVNFKKIFAAYVPLYWIYRSSLLSLFPWTLSTSENAIIIMKAK